MMTPTPADRFPVLRQRQTRVMNLRAAGFRVLACATCLVTLDACGRSEPKDPTAELLELLTLPAQWPVADMAAPEAAELAVLPHGVADRMLGTSNDGRWGYLLKVVDGPTLHRRNSDVPFEPASTLKVVYHMHALRQVEAGRATLADPVPWYRGSVGDDPSTPDEDEREFGCPVDAGPATDTLEVGLRAMMERSDNRWTLAVRRYFGDAAIAQTARDLGMRVTLLRHRIGCAYTGQEPGQVDAPNVSTLEEMGGLIEAASNGTALSRRYAEAFFELMANDTFLRLQTILREENAAVGLPDPVFAAVIRNLRLAWKSGKYNIGSYKCQSVVGRVDFLHHVGGGMLAWRRLVVGVYVDDAVRFPEQGTRATLYSLAVASELLRAEIRAWLEGYRRALGDTATPAR